MRRLKLVTLGILGILLLVVVLQNTKSVETMILWVHFDLPLAILIVLCLLIGFGSGYLTSTLRRRHAAVKT